MQRLERLSENTTRLAVGLMSGTSLDGVDAALARVSGSGRGLECETLAFTSTPYPPALRERLLENSAPERSSVKAIAQLNVRLAHVYAAAVRRAAEEAGRSTDEIDLIGSHGQTVYHVPEPEDCAGQAVASTLQIGDPSVLANLLGVPVVGDFRLADMACGGQGAPLVPYFDDALFSDDDETRGLLNLGGIANLTVLPAGAPPSAVIAFDTGPANMVIDALAERLFDRPCDAGGALAAEGTVRDDLLDELLDEDAFFERPPPKSTGRERYGDEYVMRLCDHAANADDRALIATATALTARSVHRAYERFVKENHPLDVLIVSGGGAQNTTLMQMLADAFAPVAVRPSSAYGVDPDAKEALCFAVLACETASGQPSNLPSATGAERPALLGKICVP